MWLLVYYLILIFSFRSFPSFLDCQQALQIATKITRGTIEILNEVHIIKKDEKVGASEATLLGMLNIHPFAYGLQIWQV